MPALLKPAHAAYLDNCIYPGKSAGPVPPLKPRLLLPSPPVSSSALPHLYSAVGMFSDP